MLARLMRLWLLFELFGYVLLSFMWHDGLGWSLGKSLWVVLLLILLTRALLVLLMFWLSLLLDPQSHQLARHPLRVWLRVLLQEWCAWLLLPLLMCAPQIWPCSDRPRRLASGQQGVLLVHGYGCNRAYWWWLKPRLEAQGLQVATLSLEPLAGSIAGYAEQLAQRVNWLCQECGSERVWLVGHGMGGLACLAYLARYGEDRTAGLLTLGTPHGGSHMARLGLGRNCEEMRGGSLWLEELAQGFALLPLRIPLLAAWSPLDNVVVPATAACCVDGMSLELPPVGHLGMGCAQEVLQLISDTLAADWPALAVDPAVEEGV